MIIQIRGTSGSGKTTVMRKVMGSLNLWTPQFVEGRRQPLYYRHKKREGLIVLGHYEIDCGGCDTIGSAPKVYQTLQMLDFQIALSEGLLWSEDVRWTTELQDSGQEVNKVRSVFLTTDPEECLRRVVIRQAGRKPVDPERVRRKLMTRVGTINRARMRLIDAGVFCRRFSGRQAVKAIKKWLAEEYIPF